MIESGIGTLGEVPQALPEASAHNISPVTPGIESTMRVSVLLKRCLTCGGPLDPGKLTV
jgi:hypothetical protein